MPNNIQTVDCIPSATFSDHRVYLYVTGNEEKSSDYDVFSRYDIAKMNENFEEATIVYSFVGAEFTSRFEAWVDRKKEEKQRLVTALQATEEWCKNEHESICAKKKAKSEFFAEKALKLDSPLELEELKKLSCFQRAVASKTEPSDKSWASLEKRIQAELYDGLERQKPARSDLLIARERLCTVLRRRRVQRNLLYLADLVLDEMLEPSPVFPTLVAPRDFVRIALLRVHQYFQLTKEPTDPPLVMDDARVVYVQKVRPALAALPDDRFPDGSCDPDETIRRATELRCAGCRRGQPLDKKQGDFVQLMEHVFNNHAAVDEMFPDLIEKEPGKIEVVMRQKASLPWFQTPWRGVLPILVSEQEVRCGKHEYTPVPDLHCTPPDKLEGLSHGYVPGAFQGRVAASEGGPKDDDFVGNIIYAASQFDETNVDDKVVTKIALEFAVRRHDRVSSTRPDFDVLQQLQDTLLREGRGGIFEGLRCRECSINAPEWKTLGYLVRSAKPFAQVIEHFRNVHSARGDWASNMLQLPCDQDILAHLMLPCNQKGGAVFEELFPPEYEARKVP